MKSFFMKQHFVQRRKAEQRKLVIYVIVDLFIGSCFMHAVGGMELNLFLFFNRNGAFGQKENQSLQQLR